MVIAGLENGSFAGWDLTTNAVNYKQAHGSAITCMYLHTKDNLSVLVTGDAQGIVKVFDTASFSEQLTG